MVELLRTFFLFSVLLIIVMPIRADDDSWEYQVIILQGVTAGSTLEKQAKGISLDTRRTRILNELAADGWEVDSYYTPTSSLSRDAALTKRHIG